MNDVEIRKMAVELAIQWGPQPGGMIGAARQIYEFLAGGSRSLTDQEIQDFARRFVDDFAQILTSLQLDLGGD